MQDQFSCQIVISGVGGQGVLFITRLLAETAIQQGLPVLTSETHGMAQRGGTVISHLKIGNFTSPLIRAGSADGLIALRAENLSQHGGYLTSGGWATVNGVAPLERQATSTHVYLDADRLAREIKDPRSVNLIMLGLTLSTARRDDAGHCRHICRLDAVESVLKNRLDHDQGRLRSALRALKAGSAGSAAD